MGFILVYILPLIIMFACVATMVKGGLWNNSIKFINVVTAALLATSFYEVLARTLERVARGFTFVIDFLAIWILFFIFLAILRIATMLASRMRVRFKLPVDMAGGVVFALLTGWIMICFTLATLHMAPLRQNILQDSPDKNLLFIGPDRDWLAFVHMVSTGSFSGMITERPFDADGSFILRYGERRRRFEEFPTARYRPFHYEMNAKFLRQGMSKADVTNLMGANPAPRIAETDDGEIWEYLVMQSQSPGGRRMIIRAYFQGDTLDGSELLWEVHRWESVKGQRQSLSTGAFVSVDKNGRREWLESLAPPSDE